MKTEIRSEVLVGYSDGRRVTVEVALRDVPEGFKRTDTHESAEGLAGVSVTSYLWQRNRKDIESGGATREYLRGLDHCVEGIDPEAVRRLADLGDRWHLNDLCAGCDHQEVVWEDSAYGRRPSLTKTEDCPETGYRYGSAWLVEPIEAEALAFFHEWVDSHRSHML